MYLVIMRVHIIAHYCTLLHIIAHYCGSFFRLFTADIKMQVQNARASAVDLFLSREQSLNSFFDEHAETFLIHVCNSGFCPGVPKHKGITIVRSLFVLCVRSYCSAAVYCWSFVSTLVHWYTRTEPNSGTHHNW